MDKIKIQKEMWKKYSTVSKYAVIVSGTNCFE